MKTILKLMPVAFALVACSNGGGGGGGAPALRGGVLTGQKAIFEATQNPQQPGGDSVGMAALVFDGLSATKDSEINTASRAKANLLAQSIKSGKCEMIQGNLPPVSRPSNSGSPTSGMPAIDMKIVGDACPVEISMKASMPGMGNPPPCDSSTRGPSSCQFTLNTKIEMNYRVKDAKLMAQLEVVQGSIVVQIDQSFSTGGSGGMTSKANASFTLSAIDLAGKEHRISGTHFANLKVETGAPQTGSSVPLPMQYGGLKEKLVYEAPDKTTTLTAEIELKGNTAEEKYYVNGTAVSAEEYNAEHEKLANSQMIFTKERYSGQRNSEQPQPGPQPGGTLPQPGTSPGTGPGTGTGSGPNPEQPRLPVPQPTPAPGPAPLPAEHQWACVTQDTQTRAVYVGYGRVEFAARSRAEEACRQARSTACSSISECSAQESDPQAWFCRVKNLRSGQLFSGSGASRVEAGYLARLSCYQQSGQISDFCQQALTTSDCVHQ